MRMHAQLEKIPLEKQQNTTEELEDIGHWLLLAKVTNVKT